MYFEVCKRSIEAMIVVNFEAIPHSLVAPKGAGGYIYIDIYPEALPRKSRHRALRGWRLRLLVGSPLGVHARRALCGLEDAEWKGRNG